MSKVTQKSAGVSKAKNLPAPTLKDADIITHHATSEWVAVSTKTHEERINIRVAPDHKSTIELAASLKGLSLTDYVRSTMIEQARADIQRVKEITLTENDVQMVLASQSNSQPSARLLEASERYLKMMNGQS